MQGALQEYKHSIWSRDTGQRIPCFDRYQLIKTWMSNIKDVCWSHWHNGGGTYVRTDDVMAIKPKFLASMGYHIFLTMVLRARARSSAKNKISLTKPMKT